MIVAGTVAAILGLFIGFTVGLITRRRSDMWCDRCGTTLTCPTCTTLAQGSLSNKGRWT